MSKEMFSMSGLNFYYNGISGDRVEYIVTCSNDQCNHAKNYIWIPIQDTYKTFSTRQRHCSTCGRTIDIFNLVLKHGHLMKRVASAIITEMDENDSSV